MGIKGDMASYVANSFSNLINSGFTFADSFVATKVQEEKKKAAEKAVAEAEDRAFNSDILTLETAYKAKVDKFMRDLPENLDHNSFLQRLHENDNEFISDVTNSGIYDERALAYMTNEYIPSQYPENELLVAGAKTYALNIRAASQIKSYGEYLKSDPSYDVESAAREYEAQYNAAHLGDIENGPNAYGYVTPEEFRELIRPAKAEQAFYAMSSDPSTGYFSGSFNFDDTMKKALEAAGYNPDSVQMVEFMADCNSVIGTIQKTMQDAADQFYQQVEGLYNEYKMSNQSDSHTFPLTDMYEAAKSYPPEYLTKFVDLAAKIESHNADVQYNVATSYIDRGIITDDVLQMLSDGYATTHSEKFQKARAEAVQKQIIDTAKIKGNGDSKAIMDYIYAGDMPITVTNAERLEAAGAFYADMQSAYDTLSDYSDLSAKLYEDELAGSPVPEIMGMLYEVEVSRPVTTSEGTVRTETVIEPVSAVTADKYPEGTTFELTPKYEATPKAEESMPLSDRKIFASETETPKTKKTVTGSPTLDVTQAEGFAGVVARSISEAEAQGLIVPKADAEPETETKTETGAESETTTTAQHESPLPVQYDLEIEQTSKDVNTPGVYTASAQNKVNDLASDEAVGKKIVNNKQAEEDVKSLVEKGAPQDIINSVVRFYQKKEMLSSGWIEDNYKQYPWVTSPTYENVKQRVVDICKGMDLSTGSIDNATSIVVQQITQAFRTSGLDWEEFEKTSLNKLVDVFVSEEVMSTMTSKLETFNKVAMKADTYYETLTSNGLYGQLITDFTSGKFDGLVDYGMIQSVLDSNIAGNKNIREKFARLMGKSDYASALEGDPSGMTKLMIETMTAIVNMHYEGIEFYDQVIARLAENGVDAELVDFSLDKDLGYVFVDSNSEAFGYALCIDPAFMVYDEKQGISANWVAVPVYKDENGKYVVQKDDKDNIIDIGAWAKVGSGLFTVTKEKPSDKQMAMEEEGKQQVQTAEEVYRDVYGGGNQVAETLGGWLLQLFGRNATKDYKTQVRNETDTLISAYKTAFGLWED